jgi:hypothetical protein
MLIFRRISGIKTVVSSIYSLKNSQQNQRSYKCVSKYASSPLLTHNNSYSFVNVMIDSKYYHTPLPTRLP